MKKITVFKENSWVEEFYHGLYQKDYESLIAIIPFVLGVIGFICFLFAGLASQANSQVDPETVHQFLTVGIWTVAAPITWLVLMGLEIIAHVSISRITDNDYTFQWFDVKRRAHTSACLTWVVANCVAMFSFPVVVATVFPATLPYIIVITTGVGIYEAIIRLGRVTYKLSKKLNAHINDNKAHRID